MPTLLFRAFYSIQIFVNNEYQHSCAVHVDGENLELHGKEMQNKNKNKHKVTKVPTAKIIEIAVANCKQGQRQAGSRLLSARFI